MAFHQGAPSVLPGKTLPDAFFAGESPVSASLQINYGYTSYATAYFPLHGPAEGLYVNCSVRDIALASATVEASVSGVGTPEEYGIAYSRDNSLCDKYEKASGISGYYWSYLRYDTGGARYLYFHAGYVDTNYGNDRYYGLSVRPVTE